MFTAHNQRQSLVLVLFILIVLLTSTAYADPRTGPVTRTNSITGSRMGDAIGSAGIFELPSGNIVIASPGWNNSRGAVTCLKPEEYRSGGIVVSAENSLIGSKTEDQVGSVYILENGNYVVGSPWWDNNSDINVGAATLVNGTTCVPINETSRGAVISANNSLIGSTPGDEVGTTITALSNGNYVVGSPDWENNGLPNLGAATWGNGDTGIVGIVTTTNSLAGTTAHDRVSMTGIVALTNGHYVVSSSDWDNSTAVNAGAATWGDGVNGTTGNVSVSNSLVGTANEDRVGALISEDGRRFFTSVLALTNGNYIVPSPYWDNAEMIDAGAVTWGSGESGISGTINSANSLVGSSQGDWVGWGRRVYSSYSGVIALNNGHYVVPTPYWDNGTLTDAGAATWGNGWGGTVGTVDSVSSLVGPSAYDMIGYNGIVTLTNGHYVVISSLWDDGIQYNAGAVTWGNGSTGIVGEVNAGNSLIGSQPNDFVGGAGVTALSNGNYVVSSPSWSNGSLDLAGAVTWANGMGATVGKVSTLNSLVGSKASDQVGNAGAVALANGNYVVKSDRWINGTVIDAGAVTWGNANGGTFGEVNSGNSLIATGKYDYLGYVTALSDGNYVVGCGACDNGDISAAGIVVWSDGQGGTVGSIEAVSVLRGDKPNDGIGGRIVELASGNYVIVSRNWDNGTATNAGAVTMMRPGSTNVGTITPENSLLGMHTSSDLGSNILPLKDGSFLVGSPWWDSQANANTNEGIVIWSDGTFTSVEENAPPLLATIGDRTTYLGKTLSFDVDADDPNLPDQTLTFSLESGAPAGAVIDPVSGQFTWALDETVTVGEYPITVIVTDDGDPALSDSETFTVTVEAANLVSNYGFENAGNNQKLAAGWKAIQLTKNDRRMCDTATKSYAREGTCAYRFSLAQNTTMKRTIQKSASKTGVVKDDTLELRGWVSATNLTAGARLSLTVTYNNGTKKVVNISLTAGTYEYQRFSKQVTLTRAVKSLKVKIEGRIAKGTFFVDDVAVVEVAPEALAVSVPAALDLRGVD